MRWPPARQVSSPQGRPAEAEQHEDARSKVRARSSSTTGMTSVPTARPTSRCWSSARTDEPPDGAERFRHDGGGGRARRHVHQPVRARRRRRPFHPRLPVARAGDHREPCGRARLQRQCPDSLGRQGPGRRAGLRSDEADRRRPGQAVRLQLRLSRLFPAAARLGQFRARAAARQSRIHLGRADVRRLDQARGRRGRRRRTSAGTRSRRRALRPKRRSRPGSR